MYTAYYMAPYVYIPIPNRVYPCELVIANTRVWFHLCPRDPDMIRIVRIRNNGLESPYLAIESLKLG